MKEMKSVKRAVICSFLTGFGLNTLFFCGVLEGGWLQEKRKESPIIESAAVRYEAEEGIKPPSNEAFARADLIFTGRIQDMIFSRAGFAGPGIPDTRLSFRDASAMKGDWPGEGAVFHWPGNPESFKFPKNEILLVAVRKKNGGKPSWWVIEAVKATKMNRELVRGWIKAPGETEQGPELTARQQD